MTRADGRVGTDIGLMVACIRDVSCKSDRNLKAVAPLANVTAIRMASSSIRRFLLKDVCTIL